MFLALKEMRRSLGRFVMLIVAIGLLVFLVLFQAAIRNGLVTTFIGGIENQSAPVLVLSTDALRQLSASTIDAATQQSISSVNSVAETAQMGQVVAPVTAGGESRAVSVVGYSNAELGGPTTLVTGRLPQVAGEVVANLGDAADGFAIGDTITVLPAGLPLKVVGQATDIDLGFPTLFTTFDTFTDVVRATNPDAGEISPNAIAVRPQPGVSGETVTAEINALGDDVDALTRSQLAEQSPGVAQVKTSFLLIFIIFGIVVPLVTGLFFLIVTFQKAGSLTLLRAVGVRSAALVRSLLVQVFIVVGLGLVVGIALYLPLSSQKLGNISLKFETAVVIFWSILFLVLGLLSSLVAARRVLAIDPIEATTGAGVGR